VLRKDSTRTRLWPTRLNRAPSYKATAELRQRIQLPYGTRLAEDMRSAAKQNQRGLRGRGQSGVRLFMRSMELQLFCWRRLFRSKSRLEFGGSIASNQALIIVGRTQLSQSCAFVMANPPHDVAPPTSTPVKPWLDAKLDFALRLSILPTDGFFH